MHKGSSTDRRPEALLIVGPTGAGKSPLGDYLACHGWNGRRCAHFDFGARLRAVGDGPVSGFDEHEVAFVRDVLERGALLENERFHIAERILRAFVDESRTVPGDLLVLNGLPRHVGQAADLERMLHVGHVIDLHCTAEVVFERLRSNSGGDRVARADDGVALVRRKLRDFSARTAPLVAHYRDRGAVIHRREVGVTTRPEELIQP